MVRRAKGWIRPVLGSKTSRRGPLLRSRAARRSATEAAEAIAILEAERDASLTARALFAGEITKLKGHVLQQQMRFSHLERGRRIARAAEAVRVARRDRIEAAPIFAGTLAEAEATLTRLREHQVEADAAETALDTLDAATGPVAVAEK